MKRKLVKNNVSVITVVPKTILEHFNLKPGDALDFRIDGDHIKAIPVTLPAKTELQGQHT